MDIDKTAEIVASPEQDTESWTDTLRVILSAVGNAMPGGSRSVGDTSPTETGNITVLVMGGPDTGKTTFAQKLVSAALESGVRAALLDADPSHGNVGPPLCIGLTTTLTEGHGQLSATAAAFVGGVSPVHYMPELLAALKRMADLAREHRVVVVDMPGSIHGAAARRLHQLTVELLSPAHVVAIHRGSELSSILAPIKQRAGVTVHLLEAPEKISPQPASYRSQRLAMRFSAYFRDAHQHTYSFDDAAFAGTWLGGGTPIAPHLFKYLSVALADYTRLYYAEQYGRHLGIMVSKAFPTDCAALGIALEQFGANEVTASRAPQLKNLIVGLESESGKLLGIGRIDSIDFKRRTLGISTPLRAPSAAKIIKFGGVRSGDDGTHLGVVLPGEL